MRIRRLQLIGAEKIRSQMVARPSSTEFDTTSSVFGWEKETLPTRHPSAISRRIRREVAFDVLQIGGFDLFSPVIVYLFFKLISQFEKVKHIEDNTRILALKANTELIELLTESPGRACLSIAKLAENSAKFLNLITFKLLGVVKLTD